MRAGGRADARDKPEAGAGEIRHAGCAVVDDGQAAGAQLEIAQDGKAGMGRGEHVDAGGAAHGVERGGCGRVIERVMREGPAGELGGVAMHDADASSADLRNKVHR